MRGTHFSLCRPNGVRKTAVHEGFRSTYNIIDPHPGGDGIVKVDERTKAVVAQRLASASGHLNGVERMACEDAYCLDVIRQIQAVQAALHKVSVMMLEAHLGACILAAIQDEDIAERERVLGEVASIFEMSRKHNYSIEGEIKSNGNQNVYGTKHQLWRLYPYDRNETW